MQDEVGKLMFEIIRGDHRGSVGTLQCVDYTCSTLMDVRTVYACTTPSKFSATRLVVTERKCVTSSV